MDVNHIFIIISSLYVSDGGQVGCNAIFIYNSFTSHLILSFMHLILVIVYVTWAKNSHVYLQCQWDGSEHSRKFLLAVKHPIITLNNPLSLVSSVMIRKSLTFNQSFCWDVGTTLLDHALGLLENILDTNPSFKASKALLHSITSTLHGVGILIEVSWLFFS